MFSEALGEIPTKFSTIHWETVRSSTIRGHSVRQNLPRGQMLPADVPEESRLGCYHLIPYFFAQFVAGREIAGNSVARKFVAEIPKAVRDHNQRNLKR